MASSAFRNCERKEQRLKKESILKIVQKAILYNNKTDQALLHLKQNYDTYIIGGMCEKKKKEKQGVATCIYITLHFRNAEKITNKYLTVALTGSLESCNCYFFFSLFGKYT